MKPNLLILGPHKCGTSSLYNYLKLHKSGFTGSDPKETFYLCDDTSPFFNRDHSYQAKGDEGWEKYFPGNSKPDTKYFVEATTHNIFQKTAIEYATTNKNDLRAIIILRDPAKRVYSSFKYTQNNIGYIDSDITFERYVKDVMEKKDLKYIKSDSSRFVLSNDIEYSKYDMILEPWKNLIGKGIIWVGLFEEMVRNPEIFYSDLFKWLDVSREIENFDLKNKTIEPVSHNLNRILISLNRKFSKIPFKKNLSSIYKKVLNQKNTYSGSDLRALKLLEEYYQDSILRLSCDFGIKLNFNLWKNQIKE